MRPRALLAALTLACTAASAARACEVPAGFAPLGRVETTSLVLAYRAVPAPVAVGKHFAVETLVCTRTGPAPTALRVDAEMPEHRHGMNYRAKVVPQGAGRWRAEGLLFHMPGRWRFVFDVESGAQRERLTHDVLVE
jgi:hypothetical protein